MSLIAAPTFPHRNCESRRRPVMVVPLSECFGLFLIGYLQFIVILSKFVSCWFDNMRPCLTSTFAVFLLQSSISEHQASIQASLAALMFFCTFQWTLLHSSSHSPLKIQFLAEFTKIENLCVCVCVWSTVLLWTSSSSPLYLLRMWASPWRVSRRCLRRSPCRIGSRQKTCRLLEHERQPLPQGSWVFFSRFHRVWVFCDRRFVEKGAGLWSLPMSATEKDSYFLQLPPRFPH